MVVGVHLSRRAADRASTTEGVASTIGAMLQPTMTRAGRNARGSLARSVHGQLGSARLNFITS
jgi:hypothetical protein